MSTEFKLSYTAADINNRLGKIDSLAEKSELPTKISDLTNDSDFATETYVQEYAQPKGDYLTAVPDEYVTEEELIAKGYLTSYTETDPTVPAWAKASTKPTYTASEVGALPSTTAIPDALSDLSDDASHRTVTDAEKAIWNAKSNFSGNYNDLTNKPTIPSVDGLASESYVNQQIAAIPTPDVSGQITTHNTSTAAHSDIRDLITGLTTRLNALADSDDATLDQMSEIVAYIKSNKTLIEEVTTNKVNVSDIINNLTTNVDNKPLSAAQGVALKALIDAIKVPTKVSELTNDASYLSVPVIQSAKTGQTIAIKYVDENGKPTEWETVDGVIYADEESVETAVAPINADTLGGRPAEDFVLVEDIGNLPSGVTDTTLTQSGVAADAKTVGDKLAKIQKDTSDLRSYVESVFEELRELIQNGGIESTIAVLDEAILDVSVLA